MAKRFKFRLQTLLRVRQLREHEAKRNVAAKRAEIALVDRLNTQTAEEIARQQATLLAGQRQGRLDPLALQRGRAWIAYLRRTLVLRQAQRVELVTQLGRLQEELRQVRKQARIVEKLRQRRWEQYLQERNRAEQAAADELAQRLHGSKQWTTKNAE